MQELHKHPYHMYNEILAQPTYTQHLLARSNEIKQQSQALHNRCRIFLTGCGTSYHAALAGEQSARQIFQRQNPIQAIPAFSLLNDPWELSADDAIIVLSHSGKTPILLEIIEHAQRTGTHTLAIVGLTDSAISQRATQTIQTGYSHEKSLAHTISHTLSITTLLMLINALAEARGRSQPQLTQALAQLPSLIQSQLVAQQQHHLAAITGQICDQRLWLIAGTGSAQVIAQEAALKAAETHYTPSLGLELEQALHGYLTICNRETLVIAIAPQPYAHKRAEQLLRAAQRIGSKTLLMSNQAPSEHPAEMTLMLPTLPEALIPIIYTIPLQLLCYTIAVVRGFNPDLNRRNDERYRAAWESVQE